MTDALPPKAATWLRQARHDLDMAGVAEDHGSHDWAAHGAQQAAEKALKALVLAAGQAPDLTHDLLRLVRVAQSLDLLPADAALGELGELTTLNIVSRYPTGDSLSAPFELISRRQAGRALETARAVLAAVESALEADDE